MPADATIQNALIVIAVALSVQTVLLLCTVIAISVGLKRTHTMLDAQLNRFGERLDDMATQTRMAVDAIERSSSQVNTMLHDAGGVLRTVGSFMGAPRTLLMSGVASAASAFSRWRRSRHQHQQHAAAR
jgi:uncharacterized protein YoxC